ncbi:MAG TPA: hypothetical protein VFG15_03180 [Amycolatopsis sp.]|nr:hypothetical protein [Amycolatopsis sp.]
MVAGPHRVDTLAEYAEKMDAQAARTRKLCTDQPQQQDVRTALLRAEKDIHQHGWDMPPTVFFLQQNLHTGRIRYTEFERFSRLLEELPGRHPDVLDRLADIAEFMRRQAHVPVAELDPAVQWLPPTFRDMVVKLRANPTADLFDVSGRHWRFHGVGMAYEGWMVLDVDDATEELARSHKLHSHPERIEVREVHYAARDGWIWEVTRLRRTPSIAVPRHCIALHRDNDYSVVGGIPHSLTRMCNAITSNPVPVVPATWPGDE